MNTCSAFCTAKTYSFKDLHEHFLAKYRASLYRDCLHAEINEGDIFIFPFGIVIFWNCSTDQTKGLLEEIGSFENDPHEKAFQDDFTFSPHNSASRLHEDHIYLTSDDTLEKLAYSHGIAQSLKLSELENYAQQNIDKTTHIPRNIAKTGQSGMARREIAMLRGTLFIVETDINLTFELLDTPEFFWEYPEAEPFYTITTKYLDVVSRIEILNKKVSIIRDLLDILANEQNHKHSNFLEWIIIYLIAIEILIFIVHDLLKLI